MAMDNFRLPRKRGALWGDGTDDYIDCGSTPFLGAAWTVTWNFWLQSDKNTYPGLWQLATTAGEGISCMATKNSTYRPFFFGNSAFVWVLDIPVNLDLYLKTRQFMGLSWNGSTFACFLNTAFIALRSAPKGSVRPNHNYLGKGVVLLNYFAEGSIWDVRIFNRVLALADLQAIATGGVVSGVSAHWQGTGHTDADWLDLSGNGHHGTVNGSPESGCMIHKAQNKVIRTIGGVRTVVV